MAQLSGRPSVFRAPGSLRVGRVRELDRLARHHEHVGRRGQEGQRGVRPGEREAAGEDVRCHRDQHVAAAIGVQVVAEGQAAVERSQPVRHRRHVGQQVDAGGRQCRPCRRPRLVAPG